MIYVIQNIGYDYHRFVEVVGAKLTLSDAMEVAEGINLQRSLVGSKVLPIILDRSLSPETEGDGDSSLSTSDGHILIESFE